MSTGRRAGTADVAARNQNKLAMKGMLFSGIQAVGGAGLAVYAYKNSSRIWPTVCSVVAWRGAYDVLRSMRKIFWRSASNEEEGSWSPNEVGTGTIIYFGSLYAFSEAWRSNDKLWIPFLGCAALGFSYAVSATYSRRPDTLKPLLKCCQLSFEPALIVGGAAYLLRFRNHEEEWMHWLPMVITGFNGFGLALRGLLTVIDANDPNNLLRQAIELLMGGCLVTVSSICLGIYVSVKEIHQSWISFPLATGSFGAFIIVGAITYIQASLGVEDEAAVCIGGMIASPLIIFLTSLVIKCAENKMAYAIFPFAAGGAYTLLFASVYDLYLCAPRPVFIRYCLRTFSSLLTFSSSAASAYFGYRFGWNSRYCLWMMPFIPAGIYVTYKGC